MIPASSKVTPVKSKVISVKSKMIPASSKVKPVKSKMIPDKSKVIPVKSKIIPASSKMIPALSKVIPVKSKMIPALSKVIPVKSKVTPVKSKMIPVKSDNCCISIICQVCSRINWHYRNTHWKMSPVESGEPIRLCEQKWSFKGYSHFWSRMIFIATNNSHTFKRWCRNSRSRLASFQVLEWFFHCYRLKKIFIQQ